MIIKKLQLQNFMSYKKLLLQFDSYKGITLIEGKSDASSRDSNGSGKSAVLDGIVWTLYGKMLRRQKNVEDVVNRFHAEDRTYGILHLDVNGEEIIVERSRSKGVPSLRVSGIDDRSTTKGMQEKLDSIIGMDYRLFTASLMFGGAASSFCSMTDAERKRILEEMLNFDYFLRARDIANSKLSVLMKASEEISSQINSLRETAQTCEQMARSAEENSQNFEKGKREEIHSRREDNSEAAEELIVSADALIDRRNIYRAECKAMREKHTEWQQRYDDIEANYKNKKALTDKSQEDVFEARALLNDLKKQLRSMSPESHPDICPTCGQRWPQNANSSMKTVLAQKQIVVQERENSLAKAMREHELCSAKSDSLLVELDKLRKQEPDDIGSMENFTRKEMQTFIEARDAHALTIRMCKEVYGWKNTYEDQLADLRKRAAKHLEKSRELQDSVKETESRIIALRYWLDAFGKSGIPAYLIDSAVPILNKSASELASELTSSELDIYFDPASAKGSSSVFDVKVEYSDGGDSYDMSSRGEQSRIDLVVLFSIRELLSKMGHVSCNQVFIDEVFDGLDEEGVESVMRLLRKRYPSTNFFVISHDPGMKAYADSVITVSKKEGYSTVC